MQKFGRNPTCTRKAVAKKVMIRIEKGMDLEGLRVFDGFTPKQVEAIQEKYRLWSSTWIIPDLERLLEKDLNWKRGMFDSSENAAIFRETSKSTERTKANKGDIQ